MKIRFITNTYLTFHLEIVDRVPYILGDGCFQLVKRRKFLFIPEFFEQEDTHFLVVHILGKTENMRLAEYDAFVGNCGLHTDIADSGVIYAVDLAKAGVNTVGRHELIVRETLIYGREADFCAEMAAVLDGENKGITPTEKLACGSNITLGDVFTYES